MFLFKRDHLKIAASFFVAVTIAGLFHSRHYLIAFLGANINYTFLFGFLLFKYQSAVLKYFKSMPVLVLSLVILIFISLNTQDYPDLRITNPFIANYKRDIIYIPFFNAGVPRFVIWGLPSLLVVSSFIAMEGYFKKFSRSLLVKIGDASYSVYLLQLFPYQAMDRFHLNRTLWHIVLVAVLIIAGIGMLKIEALIGNSCKNYFKRKAGLLSNPVTSPGYLNRKA